MVERRLVAGARGDDAGVERRGRTRDDDERVLAVRNRRGGREPGARRGRGARANAAAYDREEEAWR